MDGPGDLHHTQQHQHPSESSSLFCACQMFPTTQFRGYFTVHYCICVQGLVVPEVAILIVRAAN